MYHVLIVVLMAILGLGQPNSKKPGNNNSLPISTMDTGGETGNIPPPPPPKP